MNLFNLNTERKNFNDSDWSVQYASTPLSAQPCKASKTLFDTQSFTPLSSSELLDFVKESNYLKSGVLQFFKYSNVGENISIIPKPEGHSGRSYDDFSETQELVDKPSLSSAWQKIRTFSDESYTDINRGEMLYEKLLLLSLCRKRRIIQSKFGKVVHVSSFQAGRVKANLNSGKNYKFSPTMFSSTNTEAFIEATYLIFDVMDPSDTAEKFRDAYPVFEKKQYSGYRLIALENMKKIMKTYPRFFKAFKAEIIPGLIVSAGGERFIKLLNAFCVAALYCVAQKDSSSNFENPLRHFPVYSGDPNITYRQIYLLQKSTEVCNNDILKIKKQTTLMLKNHRKLLIRTMPKVSSELDKRKLHLSKAGNNQCLSSRDSCKGERKVVDQYDAMFTDDKESDRSEDSYICMSVDETTEKAISSCNYIASMLENFPAIYEVTSHEAFQPLVFDPAHLLPLHCLQNQESLASIINLIGAEIVKLLESKDLGCVDHSKLRLLESKCDRAKTLLLLDDKMNVSREKLSEVVKSTALERQTLHNLFDGVVLKNLSSIIPKAKNDVLNYLNSVAIIPRNSHMNTPKSSLFDGFLSISGTEDWDKLDLKKCVSPAAEFIRRSRFNLERTEKSFLSKSSRRLISDLNMSKTVKGDTGKITTIASGSSYSPQPLKKENDPSLSLHDKKLQNSFSESEAALPNNTQEPLLDVMGDLDHSILTSLKGEQMLMDITIDSVSLVTSFEDSPT